MTTNRTDRERYQVLKGMLEDRRTEILDKLRSIRETLPDVVNEVRDVEEQSVHDFAQDLDFALMQMKAETLSKIDEAIQRLDKGSYGTCADCGTEIAEARLKALPFATLCRDCQEAAETESGEARPDSRPGVIPIA